MLQKVKTAMKYFVRLGMDAGAYDFAGPAGLAVSEAVANALGLGISHDEIGEEAMNVYYSHTGQGDSGLGHSVTR